MQGLQVASAVYGIKSQYDQNKLNQLKMKEYESEQRREKGLFTPSEAAQEYRVGADHPLYKDTEEGTIEGTEEKFRYIPAKKLPKIKQAYEITSDIAKSQLETEYRTGRVRPEELKTAVEIVKGGTTPKGPGWVSKWDIEGGKQVPVHFKPSTSATYFLAKEKAQEATEKTSYDKKLQLAKSMDDLAPAFSALKTLDSTIKSDDETAEIKGANSLLSALKRKEVATLFASGEAWNKPELIQASISQAGPEAQALWTDLSAFMQRVLKAESGAAVTPQEAARIKEKLGAFAFSSPKNLKQGIRNAKREFLTIIRTKESPLVLGGQPSAELIDYRKAPGVLSSDDPIFNSFKEVKKQKKQVGDLDDI